MNGIAAKDLAELVRDRLERQRMEGYVDALKGIDLSVVEERIREDGDWWYVPVSVHPRPQRLFPYFELLADVEGAIEESDHLNVMLVPCSEGD